MGSQPSKTSSIKLGLDAIQDPERSNVDIVAIHGLGANPETSWEHKHDDGKIFNWLKDDNGLKKDFPLARVLLFAYGSAYQGPHKMKAYMRGIAIDLLDALHNIRGKSSRKPIVLLGHSMGGIVIAKALCLAEQERERYPGMYESFSGCLFFGTPFNGAPVAEIAVEWAKRNEQSGLGIRSSLLPLLEPGNESLRELKIDFIRSTGKLTQKVELHCFYEEVSTDWDPVIGMLGKQAFPKEFIEKLNSEASREFVSRDSAVLDTALDTGLHRPHRDLVRFESIKDSQYQKVRMALKRIVHDAPRIAKARFNCTYQTVIKPETFKEVLGKLDGVDVAKKFKTLLSQLNTEPRSWILKEQEYIDWLNLDDSKDSYIWVCGLEGRGKTTAAMAAIDDIRSKISKEEESDPSRQPVLLAYFFCDKVTDNSTAEDILKSVIRQLCKQQRVLATYAEMFLKKGASETKQQAHMSIEHLWQCLRDMLTEASIGAIYFVINNLHNVSSTDGSTKKLLSLIQKDIRGELQETGKRVSTRWLFTSRNWIDIQECMQASSKVHCIDLDNDQKYGTNLKLDLKKHAWTQVDKLQAEKGYNKAITYFAGSVIGNRADNTKWIDVAVVRLAGLPSGSNDIHVRRMLERVPQDFRALINEAWTSILNSNSEDIESIKELLRALILTYQDPTETELLVLTGSSPDDQQDREELRRLIQKCKPMLDLPQFGKNGRITFVNADIKQHLFDNINKLLGLTADDIKLQHGILAMRCFGHVIDRFQTLDKAGTGMNEQSAPAEATDGAEHQQPELGTGHKTPMDSDKDEMEDTVDDESDTADNEVTPASEMSSQGLPLPYATIYWLKHADQATPDVAERLCSEGDAFWHSKSTIRIQWLKEYEKETRAYDSHEVSIEGLNALHVAATVGFQHLVECLVKEGHKDDIHEYDSMENQPLHLAATFGNKEIVERLLRHGAAVDDAGPEGTSCTPLAMAALSGDEEIMSNLITRGANKDAVATSIGPVVNGAIMSGITKAVTMLIEEGVKLSGECSEDSPWLPPLSLAALISDISMFSAILDAGSESLTAKDRAAALCYASDSGRFEVVERLLGYDHEASVIQDSLDIATREKNWNVIPLLLRKCEELECEGLFKEAATGSESLVELLEQCWKYSQGTISQGLLDNCLYTATDLEKEETVVKLLDFGADPNALGKDYGNALTAACHDGNINIVKALLNKAANIDTPEGYALQAAAAQGHIEVVKLLVERDPSIVNNVSENHEARGALQAACNHNHVDVAEFLLDNGADANLGGGRFGRPIFGAIWQANQALICRLLEFEDLQLDISDSDFETTPLHFAALVLPTDQVKLLIDAKVPIDITNPNGDTALIAAAAAGDSETVKLLLEHKADFMIGNKIGMTPLNIAAQLGHGECVRLLAARASAVLSRLNEAASEGDETALQVVASEQETRSECMAKEPQKLFDSFDELSKFCGALDSTDEGPSNEGRLAPQPTDDDGSMQESSDED